MVRLCRLPMATGRADDGSQWRLPKNHRVRTGRGSDRRPGRASSGAYVLIEYAGVQRCRAPQGDALVRRPAGCWGIGLL